MPIQTVKLSDGRTVRVNVRDDMSDKEIKSKVLAKLSKKNINEKKEDDEDEPSLVQKGAGYIGEIGIGEASRMGGMAAGAAIGTALMPIGGTLVGGAIGYVAGGLGGGWAGSEFRQRLNRPDEELDRGEQARDALINLIPGSGIGKTAFKRLATQAGAGAVIGAGAETADTLISEDRLPTAEELTMAGITGGALSSAFGVTSEVTSKFLGKPTGVLKAALKRNDPDATLFVGGIEKNAKEYSEKIKKDFQEKGLTIRESLDDEFIRLRILQDQVAGNQLRQGGPLKVTGDEMDYYMNRRNANGKIDDSLAQINKRQELDRELLLERARVTKESPEDISFEVNRYLASKHALAFNKNNKASFQKISGKNDGAAGMTTKEAKEYIQNFESNKFNESFKEIIENRKVMSGEILDTLVDGQVVSKKLADQLRKESPDYVPLHRIMDDDLADGFVDASYRTPKTSSYETRSTGLIKARGSEREVDFGNVHDAIAMNLAGAVKRAEINKANLSFVNLIRANKKAGEDIVEEVSEQAIGKRFGGDMIFKQQPESLVSFYENGQRKYLKFKPGYEGVGAAMKGVNRREMKGILPVLLGFNRFLSGAYTKFNPDFAAPNLIRDRMESMMNTAGAVKGKTVGDFLNPRKLAGEMNAIRRYAFQKPGQVLDTAEDKLYQEFHKAGGSAGGLSINSVKDLAKDIKQLGGDSGLVMKAKDKGTKFMKIVDGYNMMFEDASRFATYKNARDAGMSEAKAAFAARNSSFDPRQRGTETGVLSAGYLFINPAIQGSKNFARTMFKNKKLAAKFGGTLIGTSLALDKANEMLAGENYRAEIPEWKRNKNFIMVNPLKPRDDDETLNYFSIPVGYSMVPFKVSADYLQRYARGDTELGNAKEVAGKLTKEIVDSYNPMGGSVIPTVPGKIINEIASNKDGIGRAIRPELLEKPMYDPTLRISNYDANTFGGEIAIAMVDTLKGMTDVSVSPANMIHLYETMTGGPGKTVERLFKIVSKVENGEKILSGDIPVLRRFYGESYADSLNKRLGDDKTMDELMKADGSLFVRADREAYKIIDDLENVSDGDERLSIVRRALANIPDKLVTEHPSLKQYVVKRVQTRYDNKQKDRFMSDLKERNAETRAKYVTQQYKSLPDEESRRLFNVKMIEEKILTPDVMDVLRIINAK